MRKQVLFAVLAATTLALTSCGGAKIIDYIYTNDYHYYNRTDVPVRFESYEDGELKAMWTIEPYPGCLQQIVHVGDVVEYVATIFSYDRVRVVFGDTKELWFDASSSNTPHNLYDMKNYTSFSVPPNYRGYDYEIDEEMMNAAIPIVSL